MLDFAALPPEINSARMYSGPGSGPMLAAASAWNTMAAELNSTADSYHSVLTELTTADWAGSSSTSMMAAATPYLAWLNSTAAEAKQAAGQAFSAATAFESAFSATVPPPVVAANRTQLATLVATNVVGQNTPAIAATEAHYMEMWAQDAAAMNGYASAASAATQLAPLTTPQSTTDPEGAASQAAAVTQATATPAGTANSAVSSATSGATSSSFLSELTAVLGDTNNSALGNFLDGNFFSTMVVNGALASGAYNPDFLIPAVADFAEFGWLGGKFAGLGGGLSPVIGSTAGSGGLELAAADRIVSPAAAAGAGAGQARLVGALSVPPAWAPAATISAGEAASPVNGLGFIGSSPAGGPGGLGGVATPIGKAGGRMRRAIPKYGFRPVVMPRPPAAG